MNWNQISIIAADLNFERQTREIVPLAQDLEYLALSYVWGNETSETRINETVQLGYSMPLAAPQAIEDAMSVV